MSKYLRVPLSDHEERDFEDGEHKARALVSVCDQDVFVIHSLYSDSEASVNDKLCRLLFFIGSLKDAGAARVTAIAPYLCYARKDRKTQPYDPTTTRYVAQLFEAVGCDRLVTLDVHNLAAFQNAFRCPTVHLEATDLFVQYFASFLEEDDIVIVSPDIGGCKRVEAFRQALSQQLNRNLSTAFLEKYRSEGQLSGERLVGRVKGHVAVILDDLISSGNTLTRAVMACRLQGARKVYAAASHGVFSQTSNRILSIPELDEIIVTNTVSPFRLTPSFVQEKLVILDAAPMVAEAIRRMHHGESWVS